MRPDRIGAALLAVFPLPVQAAVDPVIDMHVHVMFRTLDKPVLSCTGDQLMTFPPLDPRRPAPSEAADRCAHPIASARNAAELRDRTIAELVQHHVRRAVVIGPPSTVAPWTARAHGLIVLPAHSPQRATKDEYTALEAAAKGGKVALFAELGPQYKGLRADDAALEPFWAMAERLDVPVGIHLGDGMPRTDSSGDHEYRAALTSPFQLEEVLIRHPRLRLYIMHAASPLIDETIAMLFRYPTLYVDVAANDWAAPRARFYGELKRLVDAGFGERIMFGSDQTIFPQAVGLAIKTIENAPFLTPRQKRDILYNNAARFLRLTPAEIAADHRR